MYNFDQIIDRRNTSCVKYDNLANVFGYTDILPMWVADMDFETAPAVTKAIMDRAAQGIYGYTEVLGSGIWHIRTGGRTDIIFPLKKTG